MINKSDTYIVCNSNLINKLKNIVHFKLDLGQSLIDKQNKFLPQDLFIQKHFIFHNQIIHLCGYLGSLPIYTYNQAKINMLYMYNQSDSLDYVMDDILSIYDNINEALNIFFTKLNI